MDLSNVTFIPITSAEDMKPGRILFLHAFTTACPLIGLVCAHSANEQALVYLESRNRRGYRCSSSTGQPTATIPAALRRCDTGRWWFGFRPGALGGAINSTARVAVWQTGEYFEPEGEELVYALENLPYPV